MAKELVVLLVCEAEKPMRAVESILLDQGVRAQRVRSCFEVRSAFRGPAKPALIFTDVAVADGTWADVLSVANAAPESIPVIVVSRFVDVPLYLDVSEAGAYDFIVPPFTAPDLAYIVSGAALRARDAASARSSQIKGIFRSDRG